MYMSIGYPVCRVLEDTNANVALSPNGQDVLVQVRGELAKICNIETNQTTSLQVRVKCATFSADGRKLAMALYDSHSAHVHDLDADSYQDLTAEGIGIMTALAFSSDSTKLVTGSNDGKVRVWSIETGACLKIFEHTRHAEVVSVAYSPDGTKVASGGDLYDKRLCIWDIETGNVISRHVPAGYHGVYSMAFSPDSAKLATSSVGVQVWDVASGRRIGWRSNDVLLWNLGNCEQAVVSFSEDGTMIWALGFDFTLRSWDVRFGWGGITELRNQDGTLFNQAVRNLVAADIAVSASTDQLCISKVNTYFWNLKQWKLDGTNIDWESVMRNPVEYVEFGSDALENELKQRFHALIERIPPTLSQELKKIVVSYTGYVATIRNFTYY